MVNKQIGFLVKTYPKVSETFILNEILALEQRGFNLHIFSLCKPTDDKSHTLTSKVRANVTYLPSTSDGTDQECEGYLSYLYRQQSHLINTTVAEFTTTNIIKSQLVYQAAFLALSVNHLGISHIHAHFASEPASVAVLVCFLADVSYSISAHAKDIYLSSPEILRRKIAGASFVVTCTDYNRRYLESISRGDKPIHCLYHGLDENRFSPTERGQYPKIFRILSVGRFREKKGFRYLLEACLLLKKRGYRFQCDIVGYGPQQKIMESFIQELDLNEIVYLPGKLTHDELMEYYRRATVFVLPCVIAGDGDRDGIPNVLLEAMAMEKPVVSTTISGIPEVVENMKNGLLVPPGNAKALADVIALVFQEPQLRKAFGKAGRHTVCKRFSISRNISRLASLLNESLEIREYQKDIKRKYGRKHATQSQT